MTDHPYPFEYFSDQLEVQQNDLAMRLLSKITKSVSKSKSIDEQEWINIKSEVAYYLKGLREYELVLLAHWITSYHPENKLWYKFIYGLILESLNKKYLTTPYQELKIESSRKFTKAKINRAKQIIQCEEVATSNGVVLRRSGQNLTGSCPFHEDNTPSFTIFPDNKFKCFGCDMSGDSIALLDQFNKVGSYDRR